MNTRTEHRDRHHSALPLQLARAALQQRSPIPRHKVHLVHKEEDRRFGRVLLQRVEAIAIVRRVLDGVVRADLENVYEHADVLKDRRALRREVRIHESVLAAAVPEVEDEVAEETDVVLLDVDGRAEARRERGGIVGAVQLEKGKKKGLRFNYARLFSPAASRSGDAQDEGAHGGFPAPRCTHEKNLGSW
jgi:hypothetical protein